MSGEPPRRQEAWREGSEGMNSALKFIYDQAPLFVQNLILTGYSALLDRERYGGAFRVYQELLSRTEHYSTEELRSYQDGLLRELIKHVYETVPYYRRIMDERKLVPSDIGTREDLSKLPLLTKEDIRRNFGQLISRKYRPSELKEGHTSGTTGSPLTVCYDQAAIHMAYAALDRQYRWAGCTLSRGGDRIAVARGNVIVPLSQKGSPYWRYNRYHNQLLLSSFHLSSDNLPLYIDEMKKFKPVVLDGYPSTLYILAKHLKNHAEKFPLRAVISSSETLYDVQREVIEESFQCRMFDYYALAERVVFATECEQHDGHHLNMEYGISEVLDGDNQPLNAGQTGRWVGTGLSNFGMPLIRYVTSDMTAVRGNPCSCGRGLTLMDDVTTKAEDTLTLRDGRLISPSVLTHPFKPLTSIEESQIIQRDYDHIVVKIVRGVGYSDSDTRHLVRELRVRLGSGVDITVEFVERISRTKGGKFRWVVSEVPLGV